MANKWNCSLTPYHKKEGISYLIRKLNRYARNVSKNYCALAVESMAKQIANDTAEAYQQASYDGKINVRVRHFTSPSGGGMAGDKEVIVEARPVKGQRLIKDAQGRLVADVYTTWCVEVKGQLGSFLEFGTGDKYREVGYAYRFASTYIQHNNKHFKGLGGLDTWVYKGEAGTNPATPNNQVHKKNGDIREGYYYSQGNYPTRGLYNAVRKFKRSPSNVRNVLSRAYYEFMKTIY